jgi:hypothetical protein
MSGATSIAHTHPGQDGTICPNLILTQLAAIEAAGQVQERGNQCDVVPGSCNGGLGINATRLRHLKVRQKTVESVPEKRVRKNRHGQNPCPDLPSQC